MKTLCEQEPELLDRMRDIADRCRELVRIITDREKNQNRTMTKLALSLYKRSLDIIAEALEDDDKEAKGGWPSEE
jgi:hypothetical protein